MAQPTIQEQFKADKAAITERYGYQSKDWFIGMIGLAASYADHADEIEEVAEILEDDDLDEAVGDRDHDDLLEETDR